jgi:hypothetical protein
MRVKEKTRLRRKKTEGRTLRFLIPFTQPHPTIP